MELGYTELAGAGAWGALVVVLVLWVRHLQDKLLSVVDKNTEALCGVKSALEKCQMIHDPRGSMSGGR